MIECAQCGTANMFDGAAFCRSCGAKLDGPRAVATATKTSKKNRQDQDTPENFNRSAERADHADQADHVAADHPDNDLEVRESYEEPENQGNEDQDLDRLNAQDLDSDRMAGNFSAQPAAGEASGTTDSHKPNASDFDRALETYNRQADEPQQLSAADDEGHESLEIESAADVLMRTQADEKVEQPEPRSSLTPGEAQKPSADGSPLQEAVSASERQQLLDNLNKTLHPNSEAHPATDSGDDSVSDSAPATTLPSAYDDIDSDQVDIGWGATPEIDADTDSPAHDILHYRGNKVLLAMTPPPRQGETIKFRGKKYALRKGPLDKKTLGLSAALVLVLLAIILVQQLTAPVPPEPALFGVVKNSETNEVLAGVNVSIPQLDIFTITDEYGSFRFAGLHNNTYQVRLEGELYEAKFYPVSITDNNSAFLQASLDPILNQPKQSRSAVDDEPQETKPRVGQLKISCNVEDASVIVNGKDLGTTGRTFSRMKIGEHELLVRKEGYQDFTQPIKIDPGELTEVNVNLLAVEPDEPKVATAADHFEKAEELMQLHKYTEAAGHYTLALAKDKDYVQAYLRRAEANVALKKDLAARADYRAAADFYLNSNRYRNAIVCFDKILELAPNSVGALQMRGWAKIWNDDKEGGLFDLNRALSIVPEDVDARFQVGKALYVTGNFKEAEKALKKLKDDADKKPEIYAYLALTHLARGDEKDARKSYEKFQQYANSTLQARMSAENDWQKLLAIQEN